jgi:hypothetical protein
VFEFADCASVPSSLASCMELAALDARVSFVLGNASLNLWSRCVNTLWLFFVGLPSTHLRFLEYVQLIVFRFWRLWLLLALIFGLHRAWLLAVSTFCNFFGSFFAQLGVKLGWLVGGWISSFLFAPAKVPLCY